jgi:hypothetical protein
MTNQASIVEDFWLAIARNDRTGVEAAVTSIKAPLVALSGIRSFELVEEEDQQAEMFEEVGTGTLTKTPRAVMPDTPVATVDAWNAEVAVSLVVVSKSLTCGARTSDGEVDFLACAGVAERPGGGGCGWTMHELGGKDSKKKTVLKMDLPEQGGGYAISVKSSGSKVQRPKIFLLPTLCKVNPPYPKTIKWDISLLAFKFKAREWKLFIEVYQGPSWFTLVWTRAGERGPQEPPFALVIPPYRAPGPMRMMTFPPRLLAALNSSPQGPVCRFTHFGPARTCCQEHLLWRLSKRG